MNAEKSIQVLKDKVLKYIQSSSLDSIEKNMLISLSHLIDVIYLFFEKAKINSSIDDINMEKSLDIKIKEVSDKLNKFLYQNYKPKEFSILNAATFSDSSLFISTLQENLCFYFSDYEHNKNLINIYYYLFHLIYYILSIIVKEKEINRFKEDIIKFYIHHIIHFFVNDKKNPEYNFFFYEGAFKYLGKKFNISFCFLFDLEDNITPMLRESKDIINIISRYYSNLINKNNQSNDELNFIGKYSKISKKILDIMKEENKANDKKTEENILLEICSTTINQIKKVNDILKENNVSCSNLDNYKIIVENLIKIIKTNNLAVNHFNLMSLNYDCYDYKIPALQRLNKFAETWEDYHNAIEQNFTSIFSRIINSDDFKELYKTTLKSSYIHDFVKVNNLTKSYNIFMKNYAGELYKYILYIPLTRGIKAYVSNYLRIVLNINSLDFIDIYDEKTKEEILKSYLLIILLQQTFHFIYRVTNEGESAEQTLSPQTMKIKECYNEIGVDIILFLFGTEYITFISEENSKLLNNLESWKKDNTNFKVFEKIYLFCGDLIHEEKKKLGRGLKCNISVNENEKIQWKMCTDATIRFCL